MDLKCSGVMLPPYSISATYLLKAVVKHEPIRHVNHIKHHDALCHSCKSYDDETMTMLGSILCYCYKSYDDETMTMIVSFLTKLDLPHISLRITGARTTEFYPETFVVLKKQRIIVRKYLPWVLPPSSFFFFFTSSLSQSPMQGY